MKSPRGAPRAVTLHGNAWVVWQQKSAAAPWVALPDRCAHRNAKLSQGRLVDGGQRLECPYHGWQYEGGSGACVKIPQLDAARPIPRACHLPAARVFEHDGVVWMGGSADSDSLPAAVRAWNWLSDPHVFVTDYALEAPYSYDLQVENLLDPAHIHFVHDGFQGNRARASPIVVRDVVQTDALLAATFEQPADAPRVPTIRITFHAPSVVDVSILNPQNQVVRKNIIYVSPATPTRCHVLFRDVMVKKHLLDAGVAAAAVAKDGHSRLLDSVYYNLGGREITERLIKDIIQQDIDVLVGQQANLSHGPARYVMPCEADRLIVLFRRWLETQSRPSCTHAS